MKHPQLLRVRSRYPPCPIFALTSLALVPNSTTAYQPGPTVTKAPTGNCSNDCVYPLYALSYFRWLRMEVTETHIAETVVLVVNKKNNSTRTSTISNTEIDSGVVTPTNVNSLGTKITSVIDYDGSTRMV